MIYSGGITRQMKGGDARWWKIEQTGSIFIVRPKGSRRGGAEEESFSSLAAAIDRINRKEDRDG